MATTPGGLVYPIATDAFDPSGDMANLASSAETRTVLSFPSVTVADTWAAANPGAAVAGRHAWITAENAVYVRTGGAWVRSWRAGDGEWQDYSPAISGLTLGSTPTIAARWCRLGSLVRAQIRVTLGSGGGATGSITVSLPAPAPGSSAWSLGIAPVGTAHAVQGAVRTVGQAVMNGTDSVRFYSAPTGGQWNASTPAAWAVGHHLAAEVAYEAA